MRSKLVPKAIKLRRAGYLYSQIADELGISKTTAYAWTHKLILNTNETQKVKDNTRKVQLKKIDNLARLNKARNIKRDEERRIEARSIVSQLDLDSNHKKLLCSVLFWCEGGKDVAGGVYFINSDPIMVQKFLSLLRSSFKIDELKFRALVHLHDYHDEATQLGYWSDITQIPLQQFHKSYRKPNTGKNTREGYPGCISVRYLDSSLGKLLKMIYSEFGNI